MKKLQIVFAVTLLALITSCTKSDTTTAASDSGIPASFSIDGVNYTGFFTTSPIALCSGGTGVSAFITSSTDKNTNLMITNYKTAGGLLDGNVLSDCSHMTISASTVGNVVYGTYDSSQSGSLTVSGTKHTILCNNMTKSSDLTKGHTVTATWVQ